MAMFRYMFAPLERISGSAFRSICHKYGADLTFTSLARVDGLVRKNKSTLSRILLRDDTPTVVQLLGSKEALFSAFLDRFEPSNGFSGFNLNLGCPSPGVIMAGQGCALVKRVSKVRSLIKIFKDHNFPVSVKLRLGLNRFEKEKKVYLNLIEGVDADFFVVHARDGSQSYADSADLSVFEGCASTGRDIIANGDISSKEQIDHLRSVGVKGVMVGRAAVFDPGIFGRLKGIDTPPKEDIFRELSELADKYSEKLFIPGEDYFLRSVL